MATTNSTGSLAVYLTKHGELRSSDDADDKQAWSGLVELRSVFEAKRESLAADEIAPRSRVWR